MKIDKKIINGSTLSIVCSGKFGIGSKGNPSAQLIRNEIKLDDFNDEDMQDIHDAVSTIHKRSEGLIHFVESITSISFD